MKSNLLKLLASPETQQLLPISIEELDHDPELLIYQRIEHQFSTEDGLVWFKETVLGCCAEKKEFRIVYDNEDEEQSYPLLQDFAMGDVHIIEQ